MTNKISNKIIEESAISEIRNLIPIDKISDHIQIDSSEPSWDGHLLFYENKEKKNNIIQIPVQVKGTTTSYKTNSFSVDIIDLNNYVTNGVIYFVVKFKVSNGKLTKPKVLARTLLGYEIKKILEKADKFQETITIQLSIMNNETDILNLCNSYKHKQKTITTSHGNLLLFNQKIYFSNITLLGSDNKFHDNIKIGEEYFVTFENNTQSFYIPDLLITEISKSLDFPVSVNKITYFQKVVRHENIFGKVILTFNNALSFELGKNESKILIKLNKNCLIKEYKFALEFLISIYKYNSFNIGSLKIPVNFKDEDTESKANYFCMQLNTLNLIMSFIQNMKIKKDYMLSSFSYKEIKQLIDIYCYNKEKISYHYFSSTNFSYKLIRLQQDKDVYIYDIFDPQIYKIMNFEFVYKDNSKKAFKCSPILFLTIDELSSIELPSVEVFVNALNEHTKVNEYTIKCLEITLNRLMLAFDKCNKTILLDFANIVLNILENYNNQEMIYKMYKCQLRFRKKEPFSKEEHEYIDLMLEQNEIPECMFCAYTLNKDKYHASLFLEKIHENWKEEAIYGIYRSLENN